MAKKVMAAGVFDLLHTGHHLYLSEAKKLGDELVVVVARDSTVRAEKGREPIIPEGQRRQMVAALKSVDKAVLGHEHDKLKIVEELQPDIIALGPDQKLHEEDLEQALQKRGLKVKVHRIEKCWRGPLNSTSKIIDMILNRYG